MTRRTLTLQGPFPTMAPPVARHMAPTAAQVLLTLLVAVAPQAGTSQPSDAQLLLWFKGNLTNGEEMLTSWQPGTDPCSDWADVVCTNGRVTEL